MPVTNNNMSNIVHCGWMTKSPPERKLRTQFRIFRSHWKKRYFVLRKPSGSLPDQYELHYYKDQRCHSRKGSIDLDQCQQIIEALNSDVFPYLLAIKTSYKHKVRTYYLATDSEHDMNIWVQWLCHVCGLRPEDQPTDIPDPKPGSPAAATSQTRGPGTAHTVTNGASPSPQLHLKTPTCTAVSTLSRPKDVQSARTQPHTSMGSDSSLNFNKSLATENSPSRTHISTSRHNSVKSNPDFEAPPLPQKRHGHSNGVQALEDEVFVPSVYDHPPTQRSMEASSHWKSSCQNKSLPVSALRSIKVCVDEAGRSLPPNVPSCHDHSPHTSLSAPPSDSWTSDGMSGYPVTSRDGCDYPHPHHGSTTSSDNEIPPERPPKPHHLTSPYQNLPQTGKITAGTDLMSIMPAPVRLLPVTGYDIPRLSAQSSPQHHHSELAHVPTASTKSSHHTSTSSSSHIYLNTGDHPCSFELPVVGQSSGYAEAAGAQPATPPPRAGFVGEPLNDRALSSMYQCPPSSHIASGSPAHPRVPASQGSRTHNGNPASSQLQDEGTSSIFSTKRTRSFKSPHSLKSNVIRHSPKAKALSLSVTVPAPRPVLPPRPPDHPTSEDDEQVRSLDQEEETHHPLSLLRSVPAPSAEADRELKYIDLAMPESCQETARFPHSHGHTHHSHHSHSHHSHSHHSHSHHSHSHADRGKEVATEYREIDFVKTQALSDTKRVKEKERKNDDLN